MWTTSAGCERNGSSRRSRRFSRRADGSSGHERIYGRWFAFQLPDSDTKEGSMTETYRANVTGTEPLAEGVTQVTIAFERPFTFAPGQYVSVHFGDGVSRAYCIASAPQRPQAVQLCVRIAGGAGSGAVRE